MRRERRFEVLRAPRAEHRAEVEGATRQELVLDGLEGLRVGEALLRGSEGTACRGPPLHDRGRHRVDAPSRTAPRSTPRASPRLWGRHAPRATASRPGGVMRRGPPRRGRGRRAPRAAESCRVEVGGATRQERVADGSGVRASRATSPRLERTCTRALCLRAPLRGSRAPGAEGLLLRGHREYRGNRHTMRERAQATCEPRVRGRRCRELPCEKNEGHRVLNSRAACHRAPRTGGRGSCPEAHH